VDEIELPFIQIILAEQELQKVDPSDLARKELERRIAHLHEFILTAAQALEGMQEILERSSAEKKGGRSKPNAKPPRSGKARNMPSKSGSRKVRSRA
jgi:hypothetical protein